MALAFISRPKQPLWWGSPCHRLHMNSLRYSCYLLTIDQVSTDHRPSVDQLLIDTSVKYRRTIGEVSVKYRWTKSYIGRDTSGTTIDRVSTECRPTIDRLLTAISTEYRPSVDRVSTECRPSIDRLSTDYRPTVDRLSTAISTDRSVDTTYSKHDPFFSHTNPYTFECYATMPLLADAHISSLGYLWSSSKFGGRSSKRWKHR